MNKVLDTFFGKTIKVGNLEVTYTNGTTRAYGDGSGELVTLRFTDRALERRAALRPDPAFAEAYMEGTLETNSHTIYPALHVVFSNTVNYDTSMFARLASKAARWTRRFAQNNTLTRSRKNVAHHYDLDAGLYSLFLDNDRQYSCAYFESDSQKLEGAQLAKKRHLAAKLNCQPGNSVLDIGSGWGGLGLYFAQFCDSQVTGVTLSEEQHKLSNERAQGLGLTDKAQFLLKDYRALDQKFDRIVSVGMFEHVGIGHYQEFFDKSASLLADDGVMLLHSIGRFHGPSYTSPFINKYIFPGGYIPALSEVIPMIEKSGLMITDVEILRLHYAKTLENWRERFYDRIDEARELYDERFCRMWDFYLSASQLSFEQMGMMNFQIQLTKRLDALPLTRNYIEENEQRLREREEKSPGLALAGE